MSTNAIKQGAIAYVNGDIEEDCPHASDTSKALWLGGYRSAHVGYCEGLKNKEAEIGRRGDSEISNRIKRGSNEHI